MPQEIERKFLVKKAPKFLSVRYFEIITQGYIRADDNFEIRLRQKSEKYFQTIKIGTGKSRNEIEIILNKEQFNALWPLTEKKRITKTRYYIPFNGYILEWDIYCESLWGLMTVEVEFKSEEEAEKFIPPEWFSEEVTYNENYKNKNLAG